MTGASAPSSARGRLKDRVAQRAQERRWLILAVLCLSLLVIVVDNMILNVALPTIVRELHASNGQLQWIVDSYTLVFAGLLMTSGSLADRFGRRPALAFGFVLFGVGSLISAFAGSADLLIGTRGLMGIGASLIMPTTLSIITNVFPARDRSKAIAIWAGTAGAGLAIGPVLGGFLLGHFYWGSVFLVNVPIVVIGLIAGFVLLPDSKDPNPHRIDPMGAILSIAGLASLLYGVIEAPIAGWTAGSTVFFVGLGVVLLAMFFAWESRSDHPMLDLSVFRNARFSAASFALLATFFAYVGVSFVTTQYLQFLRGYTALGAGTRLLATAIPMVVVSWLSSKVVDRVGARVVVATGMTISCLGMVGLSLLGRDSSTLAILLSLACLGVGAGLIMAPTTDSIMGSLPLAKAGVGSAVNDTARQVGAAAGIAVIGSIFATVYGSMLASSLRGKIDATVLGQARRSLGSALAVLPRGMVEQARAAFVDGYHVAAIVGALTMAVGGVVVVRWLPAWPHRHDVERQADEYATAQNRLANVSEN